MEEGRERREDRGGRDKGERKGWRGEKNGGKMMEGE